MDNGYQPKDKKRNLRKTGYNYIAQYRKQCNKSSLTDSSAIVSIMSCPREISRSVSARRKVINVSMEGILGESGKIFPLRYLSPIRAESGIYCSVRSLHIADITYLLGAR